MSSINNTDNKQTAENNEMSDNSDDDNDIGQNDIGQNVTQGSKDKKKKKKNKGKKKEPEIPKQTVMGKLILERQQKIAEEEARLKAIQEEEERKAREEEEKRLEAIRKVQEEKERKRKVRHDKIQRQKDAGTYLTKTEKDKVKKNKERLEQILKQSGQMIVDGKIVPDPNAQVTIFKMSNELEKEICDNDKLVAEMNSDSDSESESELENTSCIKLNKQFRSIISCIMGHVDTGKTSLLDKVRGTKVQEGEAGGITQQIGATFIPVDTLENKTTMLESKVELNVPGLLMIDTPGHEAFTNLRSRGCSICDIAILVIDLVHGLEPQTIESMKMLQESNTKFIIALNKIDRLYGWKSEPNRDIITSLQVQDENTMSDFDTRLSQTKLQLMENGINSELYWNNSSLDDTVSICPTSAITGEGICNLLGYLLDYSQTQLESKIVINDELNCIVMDSTTTEGYGPTIDVILINGTLELGDKIMLASSAGPVETTIRTILTPPPNRESRVKSEFIQHRSITGAIGVKLFANDLVNTIAGTPLYKITNNSDKNEITSQIESIISSQCKFTLDEHGVSVYASTLGSLEALMKFLQQECSPPVEVSKVSIGKVMKKDIVRINIANQGKPKEFNTVLAFDVEIDDEAVEEAKKLKIKIIDAKIIYHLFDQYTEYKKEILNQRKEEFRRYTVFPCIVKILPNCIFNRTNPLVIGVEVLEGKLRIGTPLFIFEKKLYLGNVTGIEINKKPVQFGRVGNQVCVKIEYPEKNNESNNYSYGKFIKSAPTYGIDFNDEFLSCSLVSRNTIDLIKQYFKDEIDKDDVKLLGKLKRVFNIE